MKKILFVAALAAAACTQVPENQCQVTIKLENAPDTMVVRIHNTQGTEILATDTIVAVDKVFTYTPTLETIGQAVITNLEGTVGTAFYLVPGEKMEMTGDLNTSVIHYAGSAVYQELNEALEFNNVFAEKTTELIARRDKALANGEDMESVYDALDCAYNNLLDSIIRVQEEYVKSHPNSAGSIVLLSEMGPEKFEELDAALSDEARNGKMAPLYQQAKERYDKLQARNAAKAALGEGNPAPDFTLTDIEGNDLALSSLRGKYVVIDFWGSWCGWCIKGMPDMKAYYEKYGEKLEIVGVDCGDPEDAWKACVEELQLPWKHVINGKDDNDVTLRYAVEGFPTKILLDPEGTIVKYIVGEDPAFYETLDSVLQ